MGINVSITSDQIEGYAIEGKEWPQGRDQPPAAYRYLFYSANPDFKIPRGLAKALLEKLKLHFAQVQGEHTAFESYVRCLPSHPFWFESIILSQAVGSNLIVGHVNAPCVTSSSPYFAQSKEKLVQEKVIRATGRFFPLYDVNAAGLLEKMVKLYIDCFEKIFATGEQAFEVIMPLLGIEDTHGVPIRISMAALVAVVSFLRERRDFPSVDYDVKIVLSMPTRELCEEAHCLLSALQGDYIIGVPDYQLRRETAPTDLRRTEINVTGIIRDIIKRQAAVASPDPAAGVGGAPTARH
jgi:hypothetical protein